MKKNYIKQMFALLLVALFTGQVNAQEVVFNFGEMDLDMSWSETKDKDTGEVIEEASTAGDILEAWSKTIDGVTITVSPKTSGSNENRFWRNNNVPQLRCYSGTITISTADNIAEVAFDAPSKFNLSANIGSMNGTNWTGSAQEIVFTVNANSQINSITVTLGEGTENPEEVNTIVTSTETINFNTMDVEVSSGTGEDYVDAGDLKSDLVITAGDATFTVTASTEEDRTPNRFWGTNNGPQLRLYNGTITISSTGEQIVGVVFGASASDVNLQPDKGKMEGTEWKGLESEIVFTVTATNKLNSVTIKFGKEDESGDDVTKVGSIEAFKGLSAGTQAKLMLEDALVIFAKGDDAFVRDQSGAIDFYQTGIEFETGQVLNGSIFGELKVFNNMPELIAAGDKTNADDITFSTGSVTPLTGIDLGEVAAYACDLVTVSLTISKEGNNFYGTDEDGNKLQVFDKFHIGYNTTDIEGKTFDITGIIIPYKTVFEIAPTEDFVGAPDETVANIAEFKALEKGTTAVLTLTNAQVIYNGGRDIYVQDASGAIDFYNTGLELKAGDVLNGTIKAQYTEFNGTPELTAVAENNLSISAGSPVSPQSMDARTAAQPENICKLVRIADVTPYLEQTTNEDGTKTTDNWYDSSNKFVQIFDKWKIGYELQEGNTYTFTGIMILYNEQPEMYVTVDPTTAGATAISNVNAELNADAPIYNLAGQRVARAEKGIFIQNGKKIILK